MGVSSILGLGLLAVLGYGVFTYNSLVKRRAMVNEGFSGIDVQLKRRSDLIPQLVEVTKAYMQHEREIFHTVTAMRTQAQGAAAPAERFDAESKLGQALTRYMAVAENYPDLKADTNFLDLQNQLSETENQIQFARRYYNGAVRDLNTLIQQFPSNVIARAMKFEERIYFSTDSDAERATPNVSL